MDTDGVVIDSCLDLIECEVLREDDRPRKWPVVTLFDEQTLGIQVDRCPCTFS